MRLGTFEWMLVVTGVLMAGCSTSHEVDPDKCARDADCAAEQRCDTATGQCVARDTPKEDRNLLCRTSTDCTITELCHPAAKACVQTCESNSDCPDSAKTCAAVSANDPRKVCQCSTNELCNQGRQNANLVCSLLDKVCAPKCAADGDCGSGRTCDTATGQCKVKQDRNLSCTDSTDCLASELCHPRAKVCVQTCAGDTDCSYSTNTCAAVSATDTRKVCQCFANELCNQGRQTANLVCSELDKVCALKCAADGDCGAGRTCDTATGQCKVKEVRSPTCMDSVDCLASELCHPTAKVCVQTCVSGADCPDSAKTCDVLSGTDSRKVCKCSTDALCNADSGTSELVCSIPDALCTPKCTEDAACGAEHVCDTATGHCKVWGGTGAPCTGEGQSSCDYGTHYCTFNTCTGLPTPTCMNYTNFANKDLLGTTGPILYGARQVSVTTDTDICGTTTPTRFRMALSAYSSVPFPSTQEGVSGFFRVKTDGVPSNGTSYMLSGDYTRSAEDPKRAEFVVNLCAGPDATTLSTGFYFVNGNFLCAQITR